jgi:ribonuclease HI
MANKPWRVYTDGSCRCGTGGWAYAILDDKGILEEHNWGHQLETTNNQMELKAVLEALSRFKTEAAFTLYSDSAYIINCFKEKWYIKWIKNGWRTTNRTPVKNKEMWQELIALASNLKIEWVHVKGHNGNTWNEYVDGKAREAMEN